MSDEKSGPQAAQAAQAGLEEYKNWEAFKEWLPRFLGELLPVAYQTYIMQRYQERDRQRRSSGQQPSNASRRSEEKSEQGNEDFKGMGSASDISRLRRTVLGGASAQPAPVPGPSGGQKQGFGYHDFGRRYDSRKRSMSNQRRHLQDMHLDSADRIRREYNRLLDHYDF